MSDPYVEGEAAAATGKSIDDCGYPSGSRPWLEWLQGFCAIIAANKAIKRAALTQEAKSVTMN